MEPRLTQEQLAKIVAEVQQLSEQQQTGLETEQVREILVELNLPPELLEPALVQLQRREIVAVQRRRQRRWVGFVVVAIALLVLGSMLLLRSQQKTLDRITVQEDRITLAPADGRENLTGNGINRGDNLDTVSRSANDELFYRLRLADAPVGQKLSLSCSWTDPSGQIVHQNQYQTRPITTPVWNTVCRYRLGETAPTGIWKVKAFLGDPAKPGGANRPLSEATFVVR